jgi:hypothetical protein
MDINSQKSKEIEDSNLLELKDIYHKKYSSDSIANI